MNAHFSAVRFVRGKDIAVAELQLLGAFDMWRRMRGLLGRPKPMPAEGIWLKPCNAVHCWFMGYAIDVLFLDAQHRVLKIKRQLKPWRMAACRGASSVVELAAGESMRLGIVEGDVLICVR
jgi:uncharacterized protein